MTPNEREAIEALAAARRLVDKAIRGFTHSDHALARLMIREAKWQLDKADHRATTSGPPASPASGTEEGPADA